MDFFKPDVEKLKHKRDISGLINSIRRAIRHKENHGWRMVWQDAEQSLVEIADASSAPEIFSLFGDPDPFMVHVARRVVSEMGPQAAEPLIEALGHQNWRVRQAAAKWLGELGATSAKDALATAANRDENDLVRMAASKSLTRLS